MAEIVTIPSDQDVAIGVLAEGASQCRSSPSALTVVLASLRPMAKIAAQECFPPDTTDIAPSAKRLFSALKDSPRRRFVMLKTMDLEHASQLIKLRPDGFDFTLMPRALVLPDFDELKSAVGAQGSVFYFHEFPKNPANDGLKSSYRIYSKGPPDFFAVHGFAAASAAVTALAKAGTTDTEKLIAAMEGMSFETPKGTMTFRKDDHQVLQDMYHWRMGRGGRPELVATIAAKDIPLPIASWR